MSIIRLNLENGQGLGNQLWNIASAYGISNYLRFDLEITSFGKFKGKDFLKLPSHIIKLEEKAPNKLPIFYEKMYHDNSLKHYASSYDEEVLEISKSVEIRGLFQSEKYYQISQININKLFKIEQKYLDYGSQFNKATILNIRGGEYKRHKDLILPDKYWHNSLAQMKLIDSLGNIVIVTDDESYSKILFPKSQIVSKNIGKCYAALHFAKNIIVSNSSFSYFPIMSRKTTPTVIAPALWSRHQNTHNIWASPCNFYPSWHWINKDGKLLSTDIANQLVESSIQKYNQEYRLLVKHPKKSKKNKLLLLLKNITKRFLNLIYPKKF